MGRKSSNSHDANALSSNDPSPPIVKPSPTSNNAIFSSLDSQTKTDLQPLEFEQMGPLSHWLGNVSIRWVLTVPFIVQIVTAVGIVGYLSFRNGQEAVSDLLDRLQTEIGIRVTQQLDEYLQDPHEITQMNRRAYELGFLDIDDLDRLEQYFHQQMQLATTLSYVNFGRVDGSFVGVGRDDDQSLYGEQVLPEQPGLLRRQDLNDQGDRVGPIEEGEYDPRTDIWFTEAVVSGEPLWTDIYQWPDQPDVYSISASYPIYADPDDPSTLVGVLGADFILSQINQFLATLTRDSAGDIFIIERQTGSLIASSTNSSPFIQNDAESRQIQAVDSPDPLIKNTASYIRETFGDFTTIGTPQTLNTRAKGIGLPGSDSQRKYLRVVPWADDVGLDWLIVVVIPESAVMNQINQNTRTTLLLCALALLVAIWVGIRTSHWITQPILFLNNAAKNLAGGAWNQAFVLQRSDEVGELAQSFNDMARQLRRSFRELETQKNSFARFFPSEYLAFLDKADVTNVRLGDHVSREMTVMFSDIRGFTSLSEGMTPGETFDFVNSYLEEVAPAVRLHNGVIVKFLGDGTMAVFPDSADSAVNAGLDTFQCLRAYNQRRTRQGISPIELGIGIHVGHMMVGIVGERTRMQADALSDTVNLTARLEGLTKFYGVSLLISGSVVENLDNPELYHLRFLGEAVVKGRKEPIGIYEVLDVEEESDRILKQKTLNRFQDGVQAYRSGRLTQAQLIFEDILSINPGDRPAQRFLLQTKDYLSDGLPQPWSGVWRFTTK